MSERKTIQFRRFVPLKKEENPMMNKLLDAVENCIENEYRLTSEQHGAKHHSPHEAYAVIVEESCEASQEIEQLNLELDEFWKCVRKDITGDHRVDTLKGIYTRSKQAACELIQVAAMAKKALQGFEIEEVKF